ncbi:oligodendrocyte-myelin glycoprotein isoform X2 [Heterodontus francisci]
MEYFKLSGCFLALSSILPSTTATCPSECLCTRNDRYVDCSGRGLTELPENIQNNIISLNISHNGIEDLSDKLSKFTNLRFLNISSNLLTHMPSKFPRALWEIYAANNSIKVLEKEDTVTQWNLRILDLSNNLIERAFLINNTLTNLNLLNFRGNRFWTVPTNTPYNLKTLDLSHNNLHTILPDTFSQDRLAKLYLNNNSFTFIPNGSFDRLTGLHLITLYGNQWECNSQDRINYLLTWVKTVAATVLGCPCNDCAQEAASTSDPSTTPLPSHTSAFTRQQTEIRRSTGSRETEGNTLHSLASQETGTSPFSQLVTSTSLNSPAPSSVHGPVSETATHNISSQTMGITEGSSNMPSANITDRPSSSTIPITVPEFNSNTTILTKSTTMVNRSNGTVSSQTIGSISRPTFQPMPTRSYMPTTSTAFSTVSEPNIFNATTSQAAMRSISSTIQTSSTNPTTAPKINGNTGTTSIKQIVTIVTTTQTTNSKERVCTGITLYIMALIMLEPFVV